MAKEKGALLVNYQPRKDEKAQMVRPSGRRFAY
jgi:hypothetical protein